VVQAGVFLCGVTSRDASELRRFLAVQAPATQPPTASQPMHVI